MLAVPWLDLSLFNSHFGVVTTHLASPFGCGKIIGTPCCIFESLILYNLHGKYCRGIIYL